VARPYETNEKHHRWTGVIRTVLLFVLTLAVIGYLLYPGRQQQAATRGVDAFCKQLAAVAPFEQALGQLDPTAVANTIPQLEQLEQVAPTEIMLQVKVIVDTSRSLVAPVHDAQSDENAPDKAWRAKQADVAGIESAGKAVQAYALTNCKIDLSTTIVAPTTTTTATPKSTATTAAKPASTTTSAAPASAKPTTTIKR